MSAYQEQTIALPSIRFAGICLKWQGLGLVGGVGGSAVDDNCALALYGLCLIFLAPQPPNRPQRRHLMGRPIQLFLEEIMSLFHFHIYDAARVARRVRTTTVPRICRVNHPQILTVMSSRGRARACSRVACHRRSLGTVPMQQSSKPASISGRRTSAPLQIRVPRSIIVSKKMTRCGRWLFSCWNSSIETSSEVRLISSRAILNMD